MIVRGAHDSIKPGVQRAKRANPRTAIPKGFQPAERATDLEWWQAQRGTALDRPNDKKRRHRPDKSGLCRRTPKSCHPLRGFFLFIPIAILRLTPQAGVPSRAARLGWKSLCRHALRALEC
jgi:hypothetical protein